MLKTAPILLACIAYLLLVACGTKGPLYIPEQRYPQGVKKGIDKDSNQAVNNDVTKKDALEANTDVASKPAP